MFAAEIVIDALAPEERFVHHPVAFGSVQLCRSSVRILVAVRVIQGIIGHFAIRIIHGGICVCDVYLTGGRHLCNLGQYTVTLAQYGRDVTARNIRVSVFISGFVVEVADISIVGHVVIELYHRIFRLSYVKFIKTFCVLVECIVVQVLCQAVCTNELAA